MQHPVISGVLSSLIASLICKIGNSFNKKPREKGISIELENFLKDLNISNEIGSTLIEFLNKFEVQNYFYTYVKYRTIKLPDSNSTKKITKVQFILILTNVTYEYINKNCIIVCEKEKIEKLYNEILRQIEEKVIDKIPEEQSYLFNILTNIELLLTDINTKEGLLTSNLCQSDYDTIISTYIKLLKNNHKDAHIYGIDIVKLDKFYVFPELKIARGDEVYEFKKIKSWEDIFTYSNIISIIGGPGYGKTTFIKSVILNYEKLNTYNADKLVPIYCDLKNYFDFKGDNKSYSIEDFLVQSMIEESNLNIREINIDILRNYLKRGRCLILFDALDEVTKEKRDDLQKRIISFFESLNQNNKIIITSRDRDFIPRTEYVILISSLNKEQVKEYLIKMSNLSSCNISKRDINPFLKQASQLIKSGFLTSFLLLSLLVNVYKSEQELPSTKNQLYKKCIEHIVRQRERKDKKTKFKFEQFNYILLNDYTFEELSKLGEPNNNNVDTKTILEHLSNEYMVKYGNYINAYNSVDEFLKFCAERTDFYVKGTKENTFKFFHRSLYDYYFSKYLNRKYTETECLLNQLIKLPKDSEVFEILMQLLLDENYPRYKKLLVDVFQRGFTYACNNDICFKNYFEITTLMMNSVTEVDYINQYSEMFLRYALKYDLDFEIGEIIYGIAQKNKVWDKYIDTVFIDYPIEFWSSIIMLSIWRYCNQLDKKIFSLVGYELLDLFFEFAIHINKQKISISQIPDISSVSKYICKKVKSFDKLEPALIQVYTIIIIQIEKTGYLDMSGLKTEIFMSGIDISVIL
jgi:hypothetical protein